MSSIPDRTAAPSDRPPVLACLLVLVALLAVVIGLAALNDSLHPAKPAPSGAGAEPPTPAPQAHSQEKTT